MYPSCTYSPYSFPSQSVFEIDMSNYRTFVLLSNKRLDPNMFNTFLGTTIDVLNQHAPCNTKTVRENKCPFMTKELSEPLGPQPSRG